ncbi:MAG: SRPBCC family protein [Methylophilaceae bacterium]
MIRLKILLITLCLSLASMVAVACGPTPQKVSKEIVINADVATVWQAINAFDAIAQWHPDVQSSRIQQKLDEEDANSTYRLITLKNGQTIEEKRRITAGNEMKLDYQMTKGDFPVSNYRGVMVVKPGINAGQTIVTWTARFNNKANMLAAPAGQDNATAISAIIAFYENGLAGLKAFVEK